jgi:hypothetical protein
MGRIELVDYVFASTPKTEHPSSTYFATTTVFIAWAEVLFLHHMLLYAMTTFRKSHTGRLPYGPYIQR